MHSKEYVKIMNSRRWRWVRSEKIYRNPLCEECKRKGRVKAAECVHHIKPIESASTMDKMEELAYSQGNLMSLCFECHSEIHAAERSHSRDAHQQREADRLERWKQNHTKQQTNGTERISKQGDDNLHRQQ